VDEVEILVLQLCGVNLSHNTAKHTSSRENVGHVDRLLATKTDPQGGGISSREKLWMKWCHLVTREVHDKRDE